VYRVYKTLNFQMISVKFCGEYMGGLGSGRRYHSGKKTTSDLRALDIRRLKHAGLLTTGKFSGWSWYRNDVEAASIRILAEIDRVVLSYKTKNRFGEWEPKEYSVYLERTPCHLNNFMRRTFKRTGKFDQCS